jgi:hypothetical protein
MFGFVALALTLVAGATGSLCVLPHVPRAQATTRSPEMPPAAEHYSLRLDGGALVPLSATAAVLLADIPLEGRHKVAISGDGQPFSAFSFSFKEQGRPDACLSQSGLYLTWRFHPSPDYKGCRCEGIAPTRWAKPRGDPS